jgi:hypothetical protein
MNQSLYHFILSPIPSFPDSSNRHFRVWHYGVSLKRERGLPHFENKQAIDLTTAH